MLANVFKVVIVLSFLASSLKSFAQDTNVEQKPKKSKPSIQIKVDANTYNLYQTDNSFSTKTDSKNIEIKDNVDSNISSENKNSSINTQNKDSNLNTDLSKDKTTETNIKDSQITNKESSDIIKDSTVSEEIKTSSPEVVVQPPVEKVEVTEEPKVIVETPKVEVPVKDVEIPVKEEVKPEIVIAPPAEESFEEPILDKPVTEIAPDPKLDVKEVIVAKHILIKPYSIRGTLGYGMFTSIDDISTNYSFGFAFGYDLNHKMNIEFQYAFSEFEDNYDYGSYSGSAISGYKFNQNDFSALFNYKLISNRDFTIYSIGGLNYASRSAENSFTGGTNSSNSFSAVFGLGTDIKINHDLFFTANFNYNLNLTGSGYNQTSSPLYLADSEDYIIFNFGLKYKF